VNQDPTSSTPTNTKPVRAVLREAGDPLGAGGRFLIALVIGAATGFSVPANHLVIRVLAAWDAGGLALLALAWWLIVRSNSEKTKMRAAEDDPGGPGVFLIVLVSSLASIAVAVLVLRDAKAIDPTATSLIEFLGVIAIVVAWFLTQTSYTLHYAHMYYRKDGDEGGIDFNSEGDPDDLDFAYFAFIIGMTFQVADTNISDRGIRRAVLRHALISFVYNTIIIGLSINLFASQIGNK
jgi:uncharacterized membrane protein